MWDVRKHSKRNKKCPKTRETEKSSTVGSYRWGRGRVALWGIRLGDIEAVVEGNGYSGESSGAGMIHGRNPAVNQC